MANDQLNKLVSDFDDFLSFLDIGGLRPNITRLGEYRRRLIQYVQAHRSNTNSEIETSEDYHLYTEAFYEINELLEIFQGIKEFNLDDELRKRLNQIISGPYSIQDENPEKSNTNARDIAYELLVGSRLTRAGYKVAYSESGDLELRNGEHDVYIECKRPSSERRTVESIRKAQKQLQIRYQANSNSRGIFAVSISKLINKQHETLSAPNIDSLKRELQQITDNYIRTNISKWPLQSNSQTFGVIVFLELPCYVENEKRFLIGTYMAVIGLMPTDNIEFQFFGQLHKKLSMFLDPEIHI